MSELILQYFLIMGFGMIQRGISIQVYLTFCGHADKYLQELYFTFHILQYIKPQNHTGIVKGWIFNIILFLEQMCLRRDGGWFCVCFFGLYVLGYFPATVHAQQKLLFNIKILSLVTLQLGGSITVDKVTKCHPNFMVALKMAMHQDIFFIKHRNLMQKILKHAILCLFAKRFDVNIVHI